MRLCMPAQVSCPLKDFLVLRGAARRPALLNFLADVQFTEEFQIRRSEFRVKELSAMDCEFPIQ